ncbi:MAG: phosphotransferase [Gammaproteobacteria bacterium]|nr:phosphotransferase [Gammaproteobacteria bacterium]
MDKRLTIMRAWLETVLDEPILGLQPASEDASFRRYFRATTPANSYVVMDAPPDKEPVNQFIAIANALQAQNVHAPIIYQQNIDQGFLVLEDLGNRTYLDELRDRPDELYGAALTTLVAIQRGTFRSGDQEREFELELPEYNQNLLRREMDLFYDWYLKRHLDLQLNEDQELIWQDTRDFLVAVCEEQPVVWVHRDYHSRNLMVSDGISPAVIDFQDMVLGPVSYDLASLVKDCYIEWPRAYQHRCLGEYLKLVSGELPELNISMEQLIRWVDLTGLQRHLKVLGIFCRLNYRDGKSAYLNDLVLVKKYVDEVLGIYPELSSFRTLFMSLDTVS